MKLKDKVLNKLSITKEEVRYLFNKAGRENFAIKHFEDIEIIETLWSYSDEIIFALSNKGITRYFSVIYEDTDDNTREANFPEQIAKEVHKVEVVSYIWEEIKEN